MKERDFEVWFAWYPVRVYDSSIDTIGKIAWLKNVLRFYGGTASSYGAELRDVSFSWLYRDIDSIERFKGK